MKEYNHIEELLERYYDGKTSTTEEQTLKDFFLQEEVPPHLLTEKEIFQQLVIAQSSRNMEEKLDRLIDQWDTTERHNIKVAGKRRIIRIQWVASIAASLLLLLGTGWYMHKPQPTIRQDTCFTPEEAYVQAEKALVMFSTALNKGLKPMRKIQKTTERVENNFYKHLNKLNNSEL